MKYLNALENEINSMHKRLVHCRLQKKNGPLKTKSFNSPLITVTSYLIPIALAERCSGRKTHTHNGSLLGWPCRPRSNRNNRSHPAKAKQICLQPQTDRRQLADSPWHTWCHSDTDIKAGECFCWKKKAWDSPFNPFTTLSFPADLRQYS